MKLWFNIVNFIPPAFFYQAEELMTPTRPATNFINKLGFSLVKKPNNIEQKVVMTM